MSFEFSTPLPMGGRVLFDEPIEISLDAVGGVILSHQRPCVPRRRRATALVLRLLQILEFLPSPERLEASRSIATRTGGEADSVPSILGQIRRVDKLGKPVDGMLIYAHCEWLLSS